MNKKGIEFSFSWIFAIIAGAVILISALYITTKLVGTERKIGDTFIASELNTILNPIETNLEDSKYTTIKFLDETRVFNECSNQGTFGKQQISTSSKLGIGNEWGDKSIRKSSFNKYVFSRGTEETQNKKLRVIVRPFFIPFKVGDLTMIYGKEYCFVNPPSDIEELVQDLSANGVQDIGINITSNIPSCLADSTKVCFDIIGCEINVNTQSKIVSKYGKELHYSGESLMLSAIFADPLIYECQLKRLMGRAGELGVLYSKKANYLEGSGCSNDLQNDLNEYVLATAINNSGNLDRVVFMSDDLEEKNGQLANCRIF
ncbi:hypothetical protein EXS72_02395 [Candidatus Pacearchaeota archaeon]|nr:hypothetical protein [Candidatus Pacearchaeota archaeon]